MDILSIALLLISVGLFFLANFVFYLESKNRINRLLASFLFIGAYTAFCSFMLNQATSVESATFWMNINLLWPLTIPLSLHLVLLFTEKFEILKKSWALPSIYISVLIFISLKVLMPSETYLNEYGHWILITEKTKTIFFVVWITIINLIAIVISAYAYWKEKDFRIKQPLKYVFIGITIPILMTYLMTYVNQLSYDILGNNMDLNSEAIQIIGFMITGCFFILALLRFGIFRLDPTKVSTVILRILPCGVFITNEKGNIVSTNNYLSKLLRIEPSKLIDKSAKTVFNTKTKKTNIIDTALKKQQSSNTEIVIKIGKEKKVFNLSFTPLKSKSDDFLGLLGIANEITEIKNIEDELKKKENTLKEKKENLEKINKFAVNRELKMIEIKKQISKLENSKNISKSEVVDK